MTGQSRVFSSASISSCFEFGRDEQPIVLFGEAHHVEHALARPRIALGAVADDVDGELLSLVVELLGKHARRSAAGLLAIGDEDDKAGLDAIVEHVGGLRHRRGQRRLAGGRQAIHHTHDRLGGVGHGRKIEVNVALHVRSRTIGDEPDAPEPGGARQNGGERGADLVDPGDRGGDAAAHHARHGAGRVEHDHSVLVARRGLCLLGL